jgi:hypothetical protein
LKIKQDSVLDKDKMMDNVQKRGISTRYLTFKNKYGLFFTSQKKKETFLQFAPFLMELGENKSE